jgi:hypothetical protein
MVHDHDLYSMQSYKYHPFTRNICRRPASLACIFPGGACESSLTICGRLTGRVLSENCGSVSQARRRVSRDTISGHLGDWLGLECSDHARLFWWMAYGFFTGRPFGSSLRSLFFGTVRGECVCGVALHGIC